MASVAPVRPSAPLAPRLQAITPAKLDAARATLASLPREALASKFQSAFHAGQRIVRLLCADELIGRGIPPAFWHDFQPHPAYTLEQRFDLFSFDVRWLRAAYPAHARAVRYPRGKLLLTGNDKDFWRESEFAFYGGRRPAWKLVGSLSLSTAQQTDCCWLRSAPVARRLQAVEDRCGKVLTALQEDLKHVRRTATFTDADAQALLLRRHQVWICGQMADGKPTETALRYRQLTGQTLSRQLAAKHLEKAGEVLREIEMTSRPQIEMT